MTLHGKTILITGANRGIGAALVAAALDHGAAQVYAGTRGGLVPADARVVPVALDVTNPGQIRAAAEKITALDVLINNAGIAEYDDLSDRSALDRHLAINFYGTYDVTTAFLPHLKRSCGAIVNNVSLMALAPFPATPAYAVSKAASFNLTQSLRALLAPQGVSVHAVLTGPTDTDMTRGFEIPKANPTSVAEAILSAVSAGEEDIFPDPMSAAVADAWHDSAAKGMERQNAAFVDSVGAAA